MGEHSAHHARYRESSCTRLQTRAVRRRWSGAKQRGMDIPRQAQYQVPALCLPGEKDSAQASAISMRALTAPTHRPHANTPPLAGRWRLKPASAMRALTAQHTSTPAHPAHRRRHWPTRRPHAAHRTPHTATGVQELRRRRDIDESTGLAIPHQHTSHATARRHTSTPCVPPAGPCAGPSCI